MNPGTQNPDTARVPLIGVAWALLAALALAWGLGAYPLMEPDEGRNAVIAQEMSVRGDLLVPHLNGLPFLDKPFLYFAATAASLRLFGASEGAVRWPSLLSTWATLALTVWFAARLFGRDSAWVAGTAFATAFLTIIYARTLIFDSMLSFFVTAALVSFYLAIEEAREPAPRVRRGRWHLLAWAAVAGGVFTKGPVALLLPLLVVVPFAVWRRRLGAVLHPAGWLLFLALVVPWLAFVERSVPGFLRYALVTETWQRLTTDTMQRTGPAWYFLPVLLGGAFPWMVLVLTPGWERIRAAMKGSEGPRLVFLGLWILLPLAFFSLSQSKRIGYVLPLIPAIAMLAAWSWSAARSRRRSARVAAAGWLALSAPFLAVGAGLAPEELTNQVAALVPATAWLLGWVMVATALVGWGAAGNRLAPVALSFPLVLLPMVSAPLMAEVADSRSGRAMAVAAAPRLTPETTIVGIETYSSSFAFYLGRPVSVSTATGAPLRSNYALHLYPEVVGRDSSSLQPAHRWQEVLERCAHPSLFLLKTRYEAERAILAAAGLPLVHADRRFVLMGPCRPPSRTLEESAAAGEGTPSDAPS